MSWGEPKALAPFPKDSPFSGLAIPDDVRVSAQVMAQPDPQLADRIQESVEQAAASTRGSPLATASLWIDRSSLRRAAVCGGALALGIVPLAVLAYVLQGFASIG